MPYIDTDLPEYPCREDMWDALKKEKRPIVVYGMGNGADKLISRLSNYGVEISDYFASDGFVRGHLFHGKRVKTFSEIKAEYDDFVILLSFASNREEVLSMLADIDSKYDMYAPDMPVAGEDEYFDREFYNSHYHEISDAYGALCDQSSKKLFAAMLHYKLTGRMKYLMSSWSDVSDIYALLPCDRIATAIDAGAYNGDTAREMKDYFPNLKKIYAIEPDRKTFKRLTKYSEAETDIEIVPINAAVWSESGTTEFFGSGNRNSTISATASFEHNSESVGLVTVDGISDGADHIKYDVEGAETEALVGSDATIKKCAPSLLISVYHRSRDIFAITNYMRSKYPNYRYYLRRTKCTPAWEIALVCRPVDK